MECSNLCVLYYSLYWHLLKSNLHMSWILNKFHFHNIDTVCQNIFHNTWISFIPFFSENVNMLNICPSFLNRFPFLWARFDKTRTCWGNDAINVFKNYSIIYLGMLYIRLSTQKWSYAMTIKMWFNYIPSFSWEEALN